MSNSAYLSVRGGMLEVKVYPSEKIEAIEVLNIPALVEWIEENHIVHITFSSSCDWPEDGGLPEDTDIRGWVDKAYEVLDKKYKEASRKDLRNKIGVILDKHFKVHPAKIEEVVDELMELTTLE